MTEQDIKANFTIIRDLVQQLAGADLPEGERQVIQTLSGAAPFLLEHALCDLNRSADALESLAFSIENQART